MRVHKVPRRTSDLAERNQEIEQRRSELEQLYGQARELAALEERNRLARDLHDSAKQKAFAALAQLGAVNGLVVKQPERARQHLLEAEGLVHEVLQEIDTIVQELHPAALQAYGLPDAAREFAFDWSARHNIEIEVQIEGQRPLPLESEQALYRIIQEALSNISRHSQADWARLALIYTPDCLRLEIADNGRGFDIQQIHAGLGLYSMRERAERLQADLQIESDGRRGACVRLRLPLQPESGDASDADSASSAALPLAHKPTDGG